MKASALVYRERVSTLLWVVVSLSLSACLKPESTTCPSGLTCPVGMMCAVAQDICIKDSPSCGDGVVQASVGEACDDGNVLDGDGCSQDCKSNEGCGNHKLDKDEVCDDGNTANGDRCSANCRSDETCGNGITDIGEVCDDGNDKDGDGCSATCKSNERCGNAIIDIAIGEVCDDGGTVDGDGCSADCRSGEQCGNKIRDQEEQCDPGPDGPTVLCNGDCTIARCGDRVLNAVAGEQCDDGGDSQACDHDCTSPVCGDGIVNMKAGELCDPGALNKSTATCDSDCSIPRCGDGLLNTEAGEQCDNGDRNGKSDCSITCRTAPTCGDGKVEGGEACDDGNTLACGQCSATCTEVQIAAKATGRIAVVPGNDIDDKNGFSLSDGMGYPVILEFNKGGGVSNGHIEVPIKDDDTAAEVAKAIEDAIEESLWRPKIHVNVSQSGGKDYVVFEHFYEGAFGNQRIIKDVGDSRFTVTGMSGGKGNDCPAGTGCTDDKDCALDLSCRSGVCGR